MKFQTGFNNHLWVHFVGNMPIQISYLSKNTFRQFLLWVFSHYHSGTQTTPILTRHTDYSHSHSDTKTTPILTQIYRILSFIDNSQTTPIYIQTTLIVTQTSPNLTQTYRLLPILTQTHRLMPFSLNLQITPILTRDPHFYFGLKLIMNMCTQTPCRLGRWDNICTQDPFSIHK